MHIEAEAHGLGGRHAGPGLRRLRRRTRARRLARRAVLETDVWDVSHPARVGYPDGSVGRPVHRIQPVRVRQRDADGRVSEGTGSLTFIAELPLDGERLHLPPT